MRKDGEIQIPLDQIDGMRIDAQTQSLVFRKKSRRSETTPEMRRIRANRWFNTNIAMAFMAKVEIWINEEAARMDTEAGGSNEIISHNMSEDTADGVIISKLRSSKGHLRDVDLIDRAALELHRIEVTKHKTEGTYTPFGLRFIDMMEIARGLSERRVEILKDYFISRQAA